MGDSIDPNKIVVFTGAGISAESGIATYRDHDGQWNRIDPMKVASAQAWADSPKTVLDYFNQRIQAVAQAQPNAAHLAVAELEQDKEVIVITQNVDDLHERAGSTQVIHLHGSVTQSRGNHPDSPIKETGYTPIKIGDVDEYGHQLRPNIVLFGEEIHYAEEAKQHLSTAGKVLVVGTSLQVNPAANLLKKARFHAKKIIVSLEIESVPFGFKAMRGKATELVPPLIRQWRGK